MATLALFVEGTFLPSREGATRRFVGIAQHLSQQGIKVVVMHCYRGWSDLSIIAEQPFITYALSPDVFYRKHELLERILTQEAVDISGFSEAELIADIAIPVKNRIPGLRIWYECHDVQQEFYTSIGASGDRVQSAASLQRSIVKLVDHTTCFTPEDYATLKQYLGSDSRLSLVPFGVDLPLRDYSHIPGTDGSIAFVGNLFHRPNQTALIDIATRMMPRLGALGVSLNVLGHSPKDLSDQYAGKQIVFHGPVPDLHQTLSESAVAIAPITTGAGVKVKVMDYLAASRPVVATSLALRGMPRDACIEVDSLDRYPDVLVDLLRAPDRLQTMRQQARSAINNMAWNTIAPPLARMVTAVTNQAPLPPSSQSPGSQTPYFLSDYGKQSRFDPPPYQPFDRDKVMRIASGKITEIPL